MISDDSMELEEESKYQVKIPLLAGSMRPTATAPPEPDPERKGGNKTG
jgi:hypothetical protein